MGETQHKVESLIKGIQDLFIEKQLNFILIEFAEKIMPYVKQIILLTSKDLIYFMDLLPLILPDFQEKTNWHIEGVMILILFHALGGDDSPYSSYLTKRQNIKNLKSKLIEVLDFALFTPNTFKFTHIHQYEDLYNCFCNLMSEELEENAVAMRLFMLWIRNLTPDLDMPKFFFVFIKNYKIYKVELMNKKLGFNEFLHSLHKFIIHLTAYLSDKSNRVYYSTYIKHFWIQFIVFLGDWLITIDEEFKFWQSHSIDDLQIVFNIINFFLGFLLN